MLRHYRSHLNRNDGIHTDEGPAEISGPLRKRLSRKTMVLGYELTYCFHPSPEALPTPATVSEQVFKPFL